MAGARDLDRLVEIRRVQPGQRAGTLDDDLIPHAGHFDVETALQALVDRLYPETGDGPLPANPINVAMQGHRYSFSTFRMILAENRCHPPSNAGQAFPGIMRRNATTIPLACARATSNARTAREFYFSCSISFSPPI